MKPSVEAIGGFVLVRGQHSGMSVAMKPAKARALVTDQTAVFFLGLACSLQEYRAYAAALLHAADQADGQVVDLSLAREWGIR